MNTLIKNELKNEFNFENEVKKITTEIADLLIEKNKSYGDSALNPIRIFSNSDTTEQIKVRIDDKLNRLAKGSEYQNEDTIQDLIGYLILLKISLNKNLSLSPSSSPKKPISDYF